MILWLVTFAMLGLGVYLLASAVPAMARLSLRGARFGDAVSCLLRWEYPLGITRDFEIPELDSVSIESRLSHQYHRPTHYLVLSTGKPSWPFGPTEIRMTRDGARAAESELERFLRDPTREPPELELRERTPWIALMLVVLGALACGPFIFGVWLQLQR